MKLEGWHITCDRAVTQSYADKYNEICTCNSCTHFRENFSSVYPHIVHFLSEFGINLMRPLEIIDMGFTTSNSLREYRVYFAIKGQLPVNKIESKIADQRITLRNWTLANEAYANTGMEKPYFIIEVADLYLRDVKGEFYEAIQSGREIEFSYNGKHYFESRHSDTQWYIYCVETKLKQHFESAEELLTFAIVDEKNINDVWEYIVINYVL